MSDNKHKIIVRTVASDRPLFNETSSKFVILNVDTDVEIELMTFRPNETEVRVRTLNVKVVDESSFNMQRLRIKRC